MFSTIQAKNLVWPAFLKDFILTYPVLKWLVSIVYDYASNCNLNVKFYNRLPVLRKPLALNRWKWILWNFGFYSGLQYVIAITFYDFDLSFLKIILKSCLYGLFLGKVYLLFSKILKQNDNPFPIFNQSMYSPF